MTALTEDINVLLADMNVEANWQDIIKTALEQGFTLLLYSLTTVVRLVVFPFFLVGAAYDVGIGSEGKEAYLSFFVLNEEGLYILY